jgi:nitroimidazol reductase NimA-like FMN-containing flavoprotein (pyridoxamine 5'-phosphate oxidase superfamily)
MRKKEKEISEKNELVSILKKGTLIRLAFFDETFPYVIPFNYGFADGCIYIHSAGEGKKIDLIQKNNRVGFEITTDVEIVKASKACGWTTKYKSVCGAGYAELLTSDNEKENGLDIIMQQHGSPQTGGYDPRSLAKMIIIKIHIESMTGKKS